MMILILVEGTLEKKVKIVTLTESSLNTQKAEKSSKVKKYKN